MSDRQRTRGVLFALRRNRDAGARGRRGRDPGEGQHPPASVWRIASRERSRRRRVAACLARMNRDYVAPRPADPKWADVIVLAAPPDQATEVDAFVQALPSLGPMHAAEAGRSARHRRRRAVPGDAVRDHVESGTLISVPPTEGSAGGDADRLTRARLHGQRLVHLARALKEAAQAIRP